MDDREGLWAGHGDVVRSDANDGSVPFVRRHVLEVHPLPVDGGDFPGVAEMNNWQQLNPMADGLI